MQIIYDFQKNHDESAVEKNANIIVDTFDNQKYLVLCKERSTGKKNSELFALSTNMSPYSGGMNSYKEEDAKLIQADSSSNKSDSSLQRNVSFNKFKPTDITIFINKQDEVFPALHSNVTLVSEEPNKRARLLLVITLLFIVLLVCIVIISAIKQFSGTNEGNIDHTRQEDVFEFVSKNQTVFTTSTMGYRTTQGSTT